MEDLRKELDGWLKEMVSSGACDPARAIEDRIARRDYDREVAECRKRGASRIYSKMMSLVGRRERNLK
jgi:hypothetical protein